MAARGIPSSGADIAIVGDVSAQGSFHFRSETSLGDIMQMVKPGADADLARVEIAHTRAGAIVNKDTVDYLSYLRNGIASGNPTVRDGDSIFVPQQNAPRIGIDVRGPVMKPGRVDLLAKSTLVDVIQAAGGLAGNGDRHCVTVLHANTNDTVSYDYTAASQNTDNTIDNPIMLDGDMVVVRAVQAPLAFTISGGVNQSGEAVIRDGKQMTLAQAIEVAGGAKDNAKLEGTTITRTDSNGKNPFVIYLNAQNPRVRETTVIQPGDRIDIPQASYMAPRTSPDPLRFLQVVATLFGTVAAVSHRR
jgi:protein involved in polysaccharide export with SLBB domain